MNNDIEEKKNTAALGALIINKSLHIVKSSVFFPYIDSFYSVLLSSTMNRFTLRWRPFSFNTKRGDLRPSLNNAEEEAKVASGFITILKNKLKNDNIERK